jgi:hypothetical protein
VVAQELTCARRDPRAATGSERRRTVVNARPCRRPRSCRIQGVLGGPGPGRTTPKVGSGARTGATVEDAAYPLWRPVRLHGHKPKERRTMILPKVRDPRFVTIRRGGTLTDSDHHLLALWAASCAEHVLHLFESAQPEDPRPREAIEHARAWVHGEVKMMQARAAGGHAMGAARNLGGAARDAAYAAGQAGPSHTSPRTNSVQLPMRSRPHVPPRQKARSRPQGDSSATGSVTSSRRRFASSCLTTRGCGTTSAGRCLTAERAWGARPHPTSASNGFWRACLAGSVPVATGGSALSSSDPCRSGGRPCARWS